MLKATHKGKLSILDIELECAVLEDKTRVLSERATTKALGGKRGGSHWRRKKAGEGPDLPVYISAKNLIGFIDDDLKNALLNPIEYKASSGNMIGHGIEATTLPKICEVYLKARDAGALLPGQVHIAEQADMLVRAFAKVGIIALIDEATGYQAEREKNALNNLLAVYLADERLKWSKKFPMSFYKEIYRLNKWPWPPINPSKRPGVVGKYTNDIVYERLPTGVLEKLKELNPSDDSTHRRKFKHHQFLSQDIGQPDLQAHIMQVVVLMRASTSWKGFIELIDRAIPKGNTFQLDILNDVK